MKETNINFKYIKLLKNPAHVLIDIVLLAIFMTSCQPMSVQANSTPSPDFQPTDIGTIPTVNTDAVIAAAKSALVKQFKVSIDAVKLVDINQVQWPDGCLGVQQPGIMCAMHVVDGYRIMLSADNRTYEIRTNLDGSQTVIVPGLVSPINPVNRQTYGIRIIDSSFSISSVDGNPDQQVVSYKVTLDNSNVNPVVLLWLEPVLQDFVSGRMLDNSIRVDVNQTLDPNTQLEVQGKLVVDTSGITKLDLSKLGSIVSGFTISLNQTIPLP